MAMSDPPLRSTRGASLVAYATACAAPIILSLVLFPAQESLHPPNAAMLLLLSVLGSAAGFGIGPGLASALLAAAAYNLFYLEPRFTLRIDRPLDLLAFGVFLVVAVSGGWLAGRMRDHARRAAEEARTTALLLEASRALARAATVDEAAGTLVQQLAAAGAGAALVLVRDGRTLRLAAAPPGMTSPAAETVTAAQAALDGATSSLGEWRFQPIGSVGVVGLRPGTDQVAGVVSALIEQGGVVIERAFLGAAATENDALREADRLRTAVLNSISHDFRTPLSSILGSATTLADYERELPPSVRRDLLASIQQDAGRLNTYVGALLDMARLDGGALKPAQDWVDVRETLGSALRRLRPQLVGRRIERQFGTSLSLVRADPILLEQAVLNLLDNAARFTPTGAAIRVAAQEDSKSVLVAIDDEGPGIPPAALGEVFDKFRRLDTGAGGLGLGLSIAKGFVEAMGGRLAATSPLTASGGARFVISLPKAVETPKGLL